MGKRVPGIDDDFVEQMQQIIEEANAILQVRGRQYNSEGVTLHNQYAVRSHVPPSQSYWAVLHIRFFRLKSMMQGGIETELILETLRDLLNEVRFLYASIKCNK